MQDNNATTNQTDSKQAQAETISKSDAIVMPEAPAAATPANKEHKKFKIPFLVIIIAIIVVALAAGVILLLRNRQSNNNSQRDPETTYSIERDPETGERPLFGSDETKDNSGEAFIEYQEQISQASDSTNEEIFDAKIAQAVYYTAVEEYDNAAAALNSLDKSTFSDDEYSRFEKVSADLEAARNGQ